MEKTNVIRERCDIPVSDTWALEDLFSSDEAWEKNWRSFRRTRACLSPMPDDWVKTGKFCLTT